MRFRIPFGTTITPVAGGPSYSPGDEAALAAAVTADDVDGYLSAGHLTRVDAPAGEAEGAAASAVRVYDTDDAEGHPQA